MTHLEENLLLAFTVGQLSGDDAAAVEAHLRECEDCRRRQQNLSSSAFSKTVAGHGGTPTRVEGATSGNGHVLEKGVELGHYVLLEKLGAGGMGEVFAAYDPRLDRKVALKLLRAGALSAQEGRARLLREAQAMARLQHPNVIAVHDVGVIGERVFVAMEYVEGETLAEWLRGRHAWDDIVRTFLAAGAGVSAAHKAGLVHRDFKPDNVLLGGDQRPRVVDFGLARQSNSTPSPSPPEVVAQSGETSLSHKLTRDGAVMGTPGYMPPEQINGLATDARSDQFSFCVALWEALYGNRPFSGTTLSQIAKEIALANFTPVPSDSEVPEYVHDAMMRGLKNNPADRWPDMDSLLRALRPRARANPRRRLFVAGLVSFSLLGIGYGLWTRQRTMVCAGMERELVGTWDAARKEKLRDAFVSTGLSYAGDAWTRTEHAIDAWAAEWVVASREVCEAAKLREEDSPELTELKTACLDERRAQLKALVSIFEAPDHDVVNTAPTAAHELEGAAPCISATRLKTRPSIDEKERVADTALRAKIVEARAQFAAGKYAGGLQRLQDISPSAAPATQAEAYLWLARLYLKSGQPQPARAANLSAAEQALKSGEPAITARALSRLYASEGFDERSTDAVAWGRLAVAAAARVPGDWEVQVELAQNEGFVEIARKRYKAAQVDFEQVLAMQREHLGEQHPDVASTLNNLGVVLTYLEQPEEAVRRYEESLQLHEQLEGADHPNVGAASHNYAVALRRLGRLRDAEAAFSRALKVRRAALGFRRPDTLRSAQALVKLQVSLGDLEAARALVDDLKEARLAVNGAESSEYVTALELESELLLAGEFWREAFETSAQRVRLLRERPKQNPAELSRALIDQAQADTGLGAWSDARRTLAEVQRLGSRDIDEADLDESLGRLELAQGRAEQAVPLLERALAARKKSGELAAARVTLPLAQALLSVGRAEDAFTHASQAENVFARFSLTRLELDAQVLKAQAAWAAHPDERSELAQSLTSLVPKLTEPRRVPLTAWLQRNEVDAGVP
ncbi:MAG: hypothetical protein DI536_23150 [Archangium gephyra]|uniref:Protein kinase domain-containing protein n=1 Tax=Archangium gephyra TaxID=48 RepID=A0A2W5T816_9BACT|nr:MAG: hypothetical protein DI536_23150 [Archangium gephyra]